MNNSIDLDINVNREQLDDTINKLEKIKDLMKEIKEMDKGFSISNVINVGNDSILIVTTDMCYCKKTIETIENDLENRIGVRCTVSPRGTEISKAIDFGTDYAKGRDYTTVTYYNNEGNPVREETTQYK